MDNVSIAELKNADTDKILDYYNTMRSLKSEHDPNDIKGLEQFSTEMANAKIAFAQKTILNEPD